MALLLAVLLVPSLAVAADCGLTSELHSCQAPSVTGYHDQVETFATPAERESVQVCWSCPFTGTACEGYALGPGQVVQYDIPAGVVYASIHAVDYFGGAGNPLGATSRDRYRIVGPPSPNPILCTARFDVGGYGGCHSTGSVAMTMGAQTVSAAYDNAVNQGPCNHTPPIAGALTLPVSANVEQPFDVTLSAAITIPPYNANAYVYGRLSFVDLPEGYSVVSCNGYGGLATPDLPESWGRLKVRYR